MYLIHHRLFWYTLGLIAVAEAGSFIAYQVNSQILQAICLGLVLLAVAILSFIRLEWGMLAALVELLVSSFGHLFQVSIGPITLSLRIGLFLTLQGVFFLQVLHSRSFAFRRSRFFWPVTTLSLAFLAGILTGWFRGNDLRLIFEDANGYLFFAYAPLLYAVLRSSESQKRLASVFCAGLVWLGAQTMLVLFIFSHRLTGIMRPLYLWIRDARLGEITNMTGDFYRIFFQSDIFALTGVFIFGVFLFFHGHFLRKAVFWLFVCSLLLVLISFSRSFWFGAAGAGIVFLATAPRLLALTVGDWVKGTGRLLVGAIITTGLIFAVVNFPFPPKGPPVSLKDLFGNRAFAIFGEAAASSRWQLLPALWTEIKKTPLAGAGFGKTVTYQSSDPRIVAETGGRYTTFAFEWNYLDIWLKLGLFGLFAYGWFLLRVLRRGWTLLKKLPVTDYQLPITYGLWLGLVALLTANLFTPYLNHPLGIGILIISAILFEKQLNQAKIS